MKSKSAIEKASWRARNPEKVAAQATRDRAARLLRQPKPRDNQAAAKAAYRTKYAEKVKAQRKAKRIAWKANVPRHLWVKARARANRSGVPFTIEQSDITVPAVCPVLGVPMKVGGAKDDSPSIDRLIPALGYMPGNIRVISFRANRIKTDATLDELRRLVTYLEVETANSTAHRCRTMGSLTT